MSYAYVGSFHYEGEKSEGIHLCRYNEKDGTLSYIKTVMPEINPGNLCIYGDLLIATDERSSGNVYTFRIDHETGDLTQTACTDTLGVNPAYITIDASKKYALITHFSVGPLVKTVVKDENGNFVNRMLGNDSPTCLYSLDPQKGLDRLLDVGLHEHNPGPMTMVHKACQKPGENFFAENDLGENRIYFFRIEKERLNYIASADVEDGDAGPRHGVFHPTLPYYYINYEHKPKVTRIDYSDLNHVKVADELELFIPGERLEEKDNQSELMLHPNGTTLYTFMRGKGIAYALHIDPENGSMSQQQRFVLPGHDPRGAFFSPDFKHILIEGHYTNAVYTIDVSEDGTLSYDGKVCEMNCPACIAFYE